MATKVQMAVTRAIKSTGVTRERIQLALIEIAIHAYNTGDYTEYTRLIDGITGVHTPAVVEWGSQFIGLKFDGKGVTGWSGKEAINLNGKDGKKGGRDIKWWTLKKPNAYAGFDLMEKFDNLIAGADRALTKAANDEQAASLTAIDPSMLEVLRKVREKFAPSVDEAA